MFRATNDFSVSNCNEKKKYCFTPYVEVEFEMDYGYGMGMGGMGGMGGSQSSMMMMSSMIGLSSCAALATAGFLMYNKNQQANNTTVLQSSTTESDPEEKTSETIVSDDLSGERLVQIGTYYLRNTSSNCNNGRVGFSAGVESAKWLWNFTKVKDWTSSSGSSYPVYTIESVHKAQQSACSQRFLTASDQCRSPPTLESRRMGDAQLWVVIKKGDGHQLRSLLCTRGRAGSQYLMQSAGNNSERPFFSSGGGSTFYIDKPDSE